MGERQVCSACGKQAACGCNARYVTKLEYVAMHKDPKKSDRANGKELGVGRMTVARAGKQLSHSGTVETKREGLDGKLRRLPEKKNGAAARPRGRPPTKRPTWVAPPPHRRKGETDEQYSDRWSKISWDKRLDELPDVRWLADAEETLSRILNWEQEYGDYRGFEILPCTLDKLKRVAVLLNDLLSQRKPKGNSKETENVVRH